MAVIMVGRLLACDEQTHNNTKLDYAQICIELDVSLLIAHSFQLEYKLSSDPIIVMVEYEWKPQACNTFKIFEHSYKALVEVPNLFR
jgi:hypothetical protein